MQKQTEKIKVKVYKPQLIEETPSNLPSDLKEYNESLFRELKNGKGLIKVRLDQDVVIQRISHDLYASWKSGIRELINNEVRACHMAQKEFSQDAYIEVTLDVVNKKLVIHGINSLGIDSKTFLTAVSCLGHSTNFEGSEVGQFGFGFASYTTISDTVIVETYSLRSKEKFAVCGKSGIGFDILPQPNLDKTGTKITLVYSLLNKEDAEIKDAIEEFARFKDVRVFLVLPYPIKEKNYSGTSGKTLFESGSCLINGKSYREIITEELKEYFTKNAYRNYGESDNRPFDPDQDIIFIEKDTEDFRFCGAFLKRGHFSSSYSDHEAKLLLVNTPIGSGYELSSIKPFSKSIVNLKNERKFQPTPDRERLKEGSLKGLSEKVSSLVEKDFLDLFDFKTWKEFLGKKQNWPFYRRLLSGLSNGSFGIPKYVETFINCLNSTFRGYVEGEPKPIREDLESLLNWQYNPVFFSVQNIETRIRTVLSENPGSIVILTKNVGLMEKCGFEDINKSAENDKENFGKTKISVHGSHIGSSGGWSTAEVLRRTTETKFLENIFDDIHYNKVVVFVSGKDPIAQFQGLLSDVLTSYRLTLLKPKQAKWLFEVYSPSLLRNELKGKEEKDGCFCGLVSFSDWIRLIEEKRFETNKGKLSGKQILERKDVSIFNTDHKDVSVYLRNLSETVVLVDDNEEYEIKSFLKLREKRFVDSFLNEKRETEKPNSYCYKCGNGTDSLSVKRCFSDLLFYVKQTLGPERKELYTLFLKFAQNLGSNSYHHNLETRIEDVEKLFEVFKTHAEEANNPFRKPRPDAQETLASIFYKLKLEEEKRKAK